MKQFTTLKEFFIENKWYYFWGIAWLVIVDIFQLVVPEVLRKFTDQLQANSLTRSDLLRYGLYILIIGVGIAFFRFLWRIFIIGTSRRLEYYLRNRLFSHLSGLSTNYYTHHKTGDLMAHATNDINAVRMALGMGVVMLTDAVFITAIAIFMMASTTDLRLTIIALLPLPILALTIGKAAPTINRRFREVQEAFSSMTDTVQENFSGIRVVKSFVQEKEEIEKFNVKNQTLFNKNMRLVKLFGLFFPFVQLISGFSYLIVIGYGGILVINNTITLGDFIAFTTYLGLLVWPVMAIGYVINVLERGSASMERLNKIFDEKPEIIEAEDSLELTEPRGTLEFKGVTFQYPNSSIKALDDFSIRVEAGKSLGIIGKTGSGKTTLASLLLRLYDVNQGQITLDGIALRRLKLKDLRRYIGYVDQDSFLFSTTIADNIAFGLDSYSQEEVERVAKIAEVHDNIMDFPLQYQTYVGERGVTLSGGQKQRISIARALIKQPKILILDDSLSAVDTNTEERILKALRGKLSGKTSIFIAHRISTIKDCDQIIVMEDGRILEQGTHESLLQRQQHYYQLYQKQLLEEKIANE